MKTTYKTLAAAMFALLFLAACGSTGNMGDMGNGTSNGTYNSEIRGTVDSVDLNNGSIDLTNVSGNNSMLSSGGGSTARIFFDNRTSVDYNGRSYHPEDLERGDQVAARVDQSNNRLYATSMSVLYDARTRSNNPSGNNSTTVHGRVRSVDTNRRTITLDDSYNRTTTVQYSANTPVTYNGQSYSPADLETGDEIDVRVDNLGGGQYAARDISVTRSVSGNGNGSNGGYGSTTQSTVRGTVRYVDTNRRTIELDSVTATNFNRGSGSSSTFIVQYDPNTQVNVQGQLYPVSGLERGDIIEVQVDNLGNGNYVARQINLLRDVNTNR